MFKLDTEHLARLLSVTADRGESFATHTILQDLSRQIKEAGGPDGSLEEQLRVMLASHEAMSKAGEEMPPAYDMSAAYYKQYGDDAPGLGYEGVMAMRALFEPIIARLRKERDEARELARHHANETIDERGRYAERSIGIPDPPPPPPPPSATCGDVPSIGVTNPPPPPPPPAVIGRDNYSGLSGRCDVCLQMGGHANVCTIGGVLGNPYLR